MKAETALLILHPSAFILCVAAQVFRRGAGGEVMSDIALFRSALRDLLRPKKLAAVAVVVVLPTLLAILIRTTRHNGQVLPAGMIYNTLAGLMVFGFVLVLLSVVFCS